MRMEISAITAKKLFVKRVATMASTLRDTVSCVLIIGSLITNSQ
jgi:hypothetical protein